MVAATVTGRFQGVPARELVVLTASDGETYSSHLSRIFGVHVSSNDDTDAYLNATFSGRTVTINYAGITDKLVLVEVIGQL